MTKATTNGQHTERTMLDLLRRHYIADDQNPAWIFAPNIQAPGTTLRKADLICQGVAAATGGKLIGHEIKVSRADLMVELADPTKSDPWQRYCDLWYLVVPDGSILTGLEIPDSWGVMTPPSGRRTRMTITRPAPGLSPPEQAPALRTLANWQHWSLQRYRSSVADLECRLRRESDANRELLLRVPTSDPRRDIVGKVIADLGGCGGGDMIGEWERRVSVDDVVAALRDLGEICNRRDDAERRITSAHATLESLINDARFVLDRMDGNGEAVSST